MQLLKETAPAKVNLTLKVLGRRADGFHEIESLAAFAGCADGLELEPGETLDLAIDGPFADALSGANLVLEAARLLEQRCVGIRTGHFRLSKQLPVAAGLGGGSADAAAALRLLQRANSAEVSSADVSAVAEELGSDISVCLTSCAALMRGRGEKVSPVQPLPVLPAVLANPGVELPVGAVYAALNAGPCTGSPGSALAAVPRLDSVGAVVELVRSLGNDLAAPATGIAPMINNVRASLAETDGCLAAEMSGSGPTCFGLYPSEGQARSAAQLLAARHPGWWVTATKLS